MLCVTCSVWALLPLLLKWMATAYFFLRRVWWVASWAFRVLKLFSRQGVLAADGSDLTNGFASAKPDGKVDGISRYVGRH